MSRAMIFLLAASGRGIGFQGIPKTGPFHPVRIEASASHNRCHTPNPDPCPEQGAAQSISTVIEAWRKNPSPNYEWPRSPRIYPLSEATFAPFLTKHLRQRRPGLGSRRGSIDVWGSLCLSEDSTDVE
jgi:hypothetical protein